MLDQIKSNQIVKHVKSIIFRVSAWQKVGVYLGMSFSLLVNGANVSNSQKRSPAVEIS